MTSKNTKLSEKSGKTEDAMLQSLNNGIKMVHKEARF